jgi:RES domain-containing protein
MRLWRISDFADLDGIGGLLYPARWHNAGRPILYTAESPAGALLEILVHLDREDLPDDFQLIEIEIDGDVAAETAAPETLSASWRAELALTRSIGDAWLRDGETLMLRVPSVLAPRTYNYLVNPRHESAGSMRIVSVERFPFDGRLR